MSKLVRKEVVSPPQPELDDRVNLVNFDRAKRYIDVSRSTLLRLIHKRRIKAIRFDGVWKFRWSDIDKFVERRAQEAA